MTVIVWIRLLRSNVNFSFYTMINIVTGFRDVTWKCRIFVAHRNLSQNWRKINSINYTINATI